MRLFALTVISTCFMMAAGSSSGSAKEPAKGKIRVLLTYGGHGFEEKPFFAMFDSLAGRRHTRPPCPRPPICSNRA